MNTSSPFAVIPASSGFNTQESEFIRDWREKRAAVIADSETRAADEHAKTLEQARKAIDRFYQDYNTKRDRAVQENRAEAERLQQQMDEGRAGVNIWDRVCKELELTGKSSNAASAAKNARDTSRMRALLLELRTDPKAPGMNPVTA